MDIDFASPDEQFLKFYIFQFLMKDQICAKFWYIKLEILFGENYGLALICDDAH